MAHDPDRFGRAMDENFDTPQRICRLNPSHVEMVERARQVGASAKFAGSGGAIVGTYRDDALFDRLTQERTKIRCEVVKPVI